MVAHVERVFRQASRHAPPFWVDVPAFTAFAADVTGALQAGELPFKSRQQLLKRADHHGLRRFDANLIIAMVQNRIGETVLLPEVAETKNWLAPILLAATLQLIIALALFVLIHG